MKSFCWVGYILMQESIQFKSGFDFCKLSFCNISCLHPSFLSLLNSGKWRPWVFTVQLLSFAVLPFPLASPSLRSECICYQAEVFVHSNTKLSLLGPLEYLLIRFFHVVFYEFDGGRCMNGLLPPYKKVLCWIFIHVLFLTKWFPKTRMPESQFSCRPRIFIEVNWGWTFLVWAHSWSQNKILAPPRTTLT